MSFTCDSDIRIVNAPLFSICPALDPSREFISLTLVQDPLRKVVSGIFENDLSGRTFDQLEPSLLFTAGRFRNVKNPTRVFDDTYEFVFNRLARFDGSPRADHHPARGFHPLLGDEQSLFSYIRLPTSTEPGELVDRSLCVLTMSERRR